MDDLTNSLALSLGGAWAAGINLYAAVFMLGWMGVTGAVDLPAGLEFLQEPVVMMAAGAMFLAEFFADKIPGVDNAWDAVHTFIRIPAGAFIAANGFGDASPAMELFGGATGGALAASSHFTKAGSRVLINSSPEPFSNWFASLSEDAVVIGSIWASIHHPVLFLILLVLAVAFSIWLIPRLWRGIKFFAKKIAGLFGKKFDDKTSAPTTSPPTKGK